KTQETQNKNITQNHKQTHNQKPKPLASHACYKDAHAHYATTNHHTNTTNRKQGQTLTNCSQAVNRQASVRMPNSTPNHTTPKTQQAQNPCMPQASLFTRPKQETKQKPANPNSPPIITSPAN
ncbi:hypothetical protein ACGUFB_08525, partial [Actinotignum schaalii]|uniref:hypothetical protein n=1 Tax=Actinotignum schaalii TaxID=59505 RepID=UPI00373E2B28